MEERRTLLRVSLNEDAVTVKALIQHPMETGRRKDPKTKEPIPAHFIQEVVCEHNGKRLLTADWGVSISPNPFLSFVFKGGKVGDTVKLSWTDNRGETGAAESVISAPVA